MTDEQKAQNPTPAPARAARKKIAHVTIKAEFDLADDTGPEDVMSTINEVLQTIRGIGSATADVRMPSLTLKA